MSEKPLPKNPWRDVAKVEVMPRELAAADRLAKATEALLSPALAFEWRAGAEQEAREALDLYRTLRNLGPAKTR